MWEKGGMVRDRDGLDFATTELSRLRTELEEVGVPGGPAYNPGWQEALNLESLLEIAPHIIASALLRTESRGSHYRSDHPGRDDARWLSRVVTSRDGEGVRVSTEPVRLTRLRPGEQPQAAR